VEPGFQKPIATHEEEQQEPPMQDVTLEDSPRRSQRSRKSAISDKDEVYVSEEIQMEDHTTSFEEAMRSAHSSKWLDAMEDEMRYMSTNKIWDLEKIPKGAKQWAANGSTRRNVTPKGILKDLKNDLWLKASRRENT
jgi:hypothetical protein